ncbi:MAG: hypothetical protein ACK5LS_13300 [Propioniciclava sp.]
MTSEHPGARPEKTGQPGSALSRRSLALGVAWTAPTIAAASALPVMAGSCPQGSVRADPTISIPAGTNTPEQYQTVPVVVTIPYGACDVRYEIRGGDGSYVGGGGILNSGSVTRTNPNVALTLTIIAGAHGSAGNPVAHDYNAGGPGYGQGGSSSWLGFGQHGTGNGHAISTAGGGGGGSAILLGTATDPNQTVTTPLVVAGGGGGGSHFWVSGSGGSVVDRQGVVPGGSAAAPGIAYTGPGPNNNDTDPTPSYPMGRLLISANNTYSGYHATSSGPGWGAVGATGGLGAHVGAVWQGGVRTDDFLWNQPGANGGNHASGMFGGGNGGAGNGTPPPAQPAAGGYYNTTQMYTAGASGGGGYAGGGGGLSAAMSFVSGAIVLGSYGTAGGAGASYITTAAVANPNGGTVSVVPDAWVPQPVSDTSGPDGWVYPEHGYVLISWS